jgi:hypothetical protein
MAWRRSGRCCSRRERWKAAPSQPRLHTRPGRRGSAFRQPVDGLPPPARTAPPIFHRARCESAFRKCLEALARGQAEIPDGAESLVGRFCETPPNNRWRLTQTPYNFALQFVACRCELVWPILRVRDQAGANRVLPQVLPLIRQRLIRPEQAIETALSPLPGLIYRNAVWPRPTILFVEPAFEPFGIRRN